MNRRTRILIVDDDPRVRLVLGRALRVLGDNCQVATAAGSREALDCIVQEPFDVIVTDLLMNGLGGVKLTEAVRRERPDAAVIWVTAHGCLQFEAERQRLGVVRCMEKPVKVDDFREAVLDASGNRSA